MARKAFYGYPEKSYYENTKYSGIVATNDPLNEGHSALLSNFDITDTGMSLVPREGFLTTTLKTKDGIVNLSDKVLIFFENKIGKHIVLDLKTLLAYKVSLTKYNINEAKVLDAEKIKNYDTTDLNAYFTKKFDSLTGDVAALVLGNSSVLDSLLLKPITEITEVSSYTTKLEFNYSGILQHNYFIKLYYRDVSNRVGVTDDTLVLDVLNLDEQTTMYTPRNIASTKSLIPDPIRYKESNDEMNTTQPLDVIKPLLYQREDTKQYLQEYAPLELKTTKDINIIPTFHLSYPQGLIGGTDSEWAYMVEVISMADQKNQPYETKWRKLSSLEDETGNNAIPELDLIEHVETPNDLYETFFVIANSNRFKVATTGAVEPLNDIYYAESWLGELMKSNHATPEYATELGNLEDAFFKHELLVDKITSAETLASIDTQSFDNDAVLFIPASSLVDILGISPAQMSSFVNRKKALTQEKIDALYNGNFILDATTDEVLSSYLFLTEQQYQGLPKLTIHELKESYKNLSKQVKFVLVPFNLEHSGTYYSTPFRHRWFCSLGGIYIAALSNTTNLATGNNGVASWQDFLDVLKIVTTFSKFLLNIIPDTVFKNFNSFNVKDLKNNVPEVYFDKGIYINIYFKPYSAEMLDTIRTFSFEQKLTEHFSWKLASYLQGGMILWHTNPLDIVYLNEIDEINPAQIEQAPSFIVFENRIVTWYKNNVFISEEGLPHYYLDTMKHSFPEPIMKVIAFKNILLVFSTQNLYAVYRKENKVEVEVEDHDKEGNPIKRKKEEISISWNKQPVLYNINPAKQYLDVIQVYNQIVLFYSAEGQLYMIKPSAQINSDTQFNIQYFNKSANDILSNYDKYLTKRLIAYGKQETVEKEDVKISALLDIDKIKVIFSVPNKIIMILIYDVVNNRYTTYDSLSFHDVKASTHVEGGSMYVVEEQDRIYFTLPYKELYTKNNNVDLRYTKSFKKEPIFTFIDTGVLNINNHLMKRFRDFNVEIKNIDATKVMYNLEVLLDGLPVRPLYSNAFKVTSSNGVNENIIINKVPTADVDELFGRDQTIGGDGSRVDIHSYYLYDNKNFFEENVILKTEDIAPNKLITYSSSILGMGKNIRFNIQFISKGVYKVNAFGLVFKERRI